MMNWIEKYSGLTGRSLFDLDFLYCSGSDVMNNEVGEVNCSTLSVLEYMHAHC